MYDYYNPNNPPKQKRNHEDLMAWIAVIVLCLSIVAATFLVDAWWKDRQCRDRAALMNLQWRRTAAIGCMVLYKDQWIPIENYRVE